MAEVKDDYLEQLKVEADWAGTYLSGDGSKHARRDEAQWWYDYFFGKSQSGKIGIERLQEARERLAALTSGDGSESAGLREDVICNHPPDQRTAFIKGTDTCALCGAVMPSRDMLRETTEYIVAKSDMGIRCWGCATMQITPVGGPKYGPFPHDSDCVIERLRAALTPAISRPPTQGAH